MKCQLDNKEFKMLANKCSIDVPRQKLLACTGARPDRSWFREPGAPRSAPVRARAMALRDIDVPTGFPIDGCK